MIEIKALTIDDCAPYNAKLQNLEGLAEYPLGDDFFKIDHGPSYIEFFKRMGNPLFHVAVDGKNLVACAAGVRRAIPHGAGAVEAWYLCDLKVHPTYRRQGIPGRMFRKDICFNYLKCGRGYAISMNPSSGENRVLKIIRDLPYVPIKPVAGLEFFSLSSEQVNQVRKPLENLVGPISFLSLAKKKDLVMRSTGQPMKLLHIQHGRFAEKQLTDPQPNHVHMICAPVASKQGELLRKSFASTASATIVSHRLSHLRWDFVLTSDI